MDGSGPVERAKRITPVLPCEGCAHAPVCAYRPAVEALRFEAPVGPAIITVTGRFTVACSERVTSARGAKVAAAWTPARRAANSQRMAAMNAARKRPKVDKTP